MDQLTGLELSHRSIGICFGRAGEVNFVRVVLDQRLLLVIFARRLGVLAVVASEAEAGLSSLPMLRGPLRLHDGHSSSAKLRVVDLWK
jgi:hypothetical protein